MIWVLAHPRKWPIAVRNLSVASMLSDTLAGVDMTLMCRGASCVALPYRVLCHIGFNCIVLCCHTVSYAVMPCTVVTCHFVSWIARSCRVSRCLVLYCLALLCLGLSCRTVPCLLFVDSRLSLPCLTSPYRTYLFCLVPPVSSCSARLLSCCTYYNATPCLALSGLA